jgi:tight adherence protein B
MSPFVVILAFAAGFLVIFGVNIMVADIQKRRREQMKEWLEEERRLLQKERARASLQHGELHEMATQSAEEIGERQTIVERLRVFFEQTGGQLGLAQLVILSTVMFTLAGAPTYMLLDSIVLAVAVGSLTGALPAFYVCFQRNKRMNALRSQLPDGFDLMARTMRAGQTFSQALLAIADESAPPLSEEFGYCYDQQNLGMSTEAAMRDLARRTGLLEIRIFVLAVLVHQQTGGNLSELLEKLAHVMRDRYRIQGMIRGLTAEGKMQAIVLLGLPVVMFLYIYTTNREYAMVLIQTTWMLGGTLLSMLFGALWIRKIINFDH